LNGLSEKTQVVLFTHHRHLVELAKNATGAEIVEWAAKESIAHMHEGGQSLLDGTLLSALAGTV